MEGKKGGEVLEIVNGSDHHILMGQWLVQHEVGVKEEEVLKSSKFPDHSFNDHHFQFDHPDCDAKLSVKQQVLLRPSLAHIGLAPLPSSPHHSHLVYSQVLNEFTHGKEEKVSETEFKEALSDIILASMAAGLKRDPIVILRIDGEDLQEYINSPSFETDAVSSFYEVNLPGGMLRDHIVKALQKLGVDQGLPPTSDSWVIGNVVEPALESCLHWENDQQPVSQETFRVAFRNVLQNIVERLRDQPVIVAHTENTYDGGAIKNLLANKFETEKVLKAALETVPRDQNGRISKENVRMVLDSLVPSTGLPPSGAISEMDDIISSVFKMVGADDGKLVKEEEFKNLLMEILGSIMSQLEGKPISASSNSVVHEPLADPTPS